MRWRDPVTGDIYEGSTRRDARLVELSAESRQRVANELPRQVRGLAGGMGNTLGRIQDRLGMMAGGDFQSAAEPVQETPALQALRSEPSFQVGEVAPLMAPVPGGTPTQMAVAGGLGFLSGDDPVQTGARDAAFTGALGGTFRLADAVLGRVFGRQAGVVTSRMSPEAGRLMRSAERRGFPLTSAQQGRASPWMRRLELAAERFGGFDRRRTVVQRLINEDAGRAVGIDGVEDFGVDTVLAIKQRFRDGYNRLYKQAGKVTVDADTYRQLDDLGLIPPKVRRELNLPASKDLADDLVLEGADLRRFRQALDDQVDKFEPGTSGFLIGENVSDDLNQQVLDNLGDFQRQQLSRLDEQYKNWKSIRRSASLISSDGNIKPGQLKTALDRSYGDTFRTGAANLSDETNQLFETVKITSSDQFRPLVGDSGTGTRSMGIKDILPAVGGYPYGWLSGYGVTGIDSLGVPGAIVRNLPEGSDDEGE